MTDSICCNPCSTTTVLTMHDPWWSEGLFFACLSCGRCCRGEPGAIWITHKEEKIISQYLGIEQDCFIREFCTREWGTLSIREKINGECIFYKADSNKCCIYEVRPLQCRLFPFWPSLLVSRKIWEKQASICPGMNHGKYFAADEIRNKLTLCPFKDL